MDSLVTNSIPTYKNSPITNKIERTIVIQTEFIKALKEHGCPSCLEILKQVVEKYVGPSLPTAANLKTISKSLMTPPMTMTSPVATITIPYPSPQNESA